MASGHDREPLAIQDAGSHLKHFSLTMAERYSFLLAVASAAAFSVDLPLARWFLAHPYPNWLGKLFSLSEVFGHGLGVAMILLAVHQFDRPRRRFLPRVIVGVLAAGLSADVVKLLVARVRPAEFFRDLPTEGSVWQTFVGWLPAPGTSHFAIQSFPSGHVATAVGLAIGMGWLYPSGRRLLVALVALVACQRMAAGAHFASDVLGGAAIGCLGAGLFFCRGRVPSWCRNVFARIEKNSP